jgi:hypothetical protein
MIKSEIEKQLQQFKKSKYILGEYFGVNLCDGWRDYTHFKSWTFTDQVYWNETDKDHQEFLMYTDENEEECFMYSEQVIELIETDDYTLMSIKSSLAGEGCYWAIFDNSSKIILD